MKLYEIDQAIMECIDMESGEILDAKRLEALQMERESKLESVACWIKNLEAEATALKAEKDALAKREQSAKRRAESLRKWLQDALQGEKLSTPKVAVSYRKSEALEVFHEDLVVLWAMDHDHMDLLTINAPDPNKAALKAYLKETGEQIPGAVLVERQNLQIR